MDITVCSVHYVNFVFNIIRYLSILGSILFYLFSKMFRKINMCY